MKKRIGILLLVLLLAAGGGGAYWYFRVRKAGPAKEEGAVFVDSMTTITGLTGSNGAFSRFSGVVEPQRTEKIELASGLKVKKVYVSVGDEVKEGTKLFSYDTEDAQDSIAQLEIDIENYDISISSAESQIKQLEKEREKVSNDEKLSYTTQIMTAQNSIKRYEYEKKSKQVEMSSLKKQIANADVTSPLQGIIKTISKQDGSDDADDFVSDNDSSSFMTIMATGDYRIKGKINEQNMGELSEGVEMIVHSRVNEKDTWKGTLSTIDREHASSNQNSMYGYDSGDSSLTTSSTYPFYIELESSEGLMLGQHVYAVVDYGQEDYKEGIWLEDYYFITDDSDAVTGYVWAADANDRLEKRKVTLGSYDEELCRYQVLEGLTLEDSIAFPNDSCKEGAPVTRNLPMDEDYYEGDMSYDDSGDDYEVIEDGDYYDDEYEILDDDMGDLELPEDFEDEDSYEEYDDFDEGDMEVIDMSDGD